MKPPLFAFAILASAIATIAGEPQLHVPEGFDVERVVNPGAVHFPMFGALADDGRLFVTESSGGDLYAELQNQTRGCRISVLRDADHDGKYERANVFFENLVPSMGLAWRDGKLFVADPPDLIVLEDTDGDGRADKRTVLLTGFGHQDNGSLHGLTFGPDGWLYMTTGQPDGYQFKRADGKIIEGKSGALLRCKPDGSEFEMLSRGFENLVEIAFMPDGEIIGTVNWFYLPQDGVRDALVHLVPGGLYPLNAHTKTESNLFFSGAMLPPVSVYPAVAQSGLMRYQGSALPPEMRGNLFSAQHNTRKIVRHQLIRNGPTFASQDEDFLSTDDPDFHPSDVLEDADGSLIVIDTGSWYIHHCPTGRIRKVPAEGGIYRVRYKYSKSNSKSENIEAHLWQLAQKGSLTIDDLKSHPAVGLRVASRANINGIEDYAITQLRSPDRVIQLAAAEALAECGTQKSARSIKETLATIGTNSFTRHALILALHHVADDDFLKQMLQDKQSQLRRAALIILDQPPRNSLSFDSAVRALNDTDSEVRTAAVTAFRKHTDWMPLAIDQAKKVISRDPIDTSILEVLMNEPEVRRAIRDSVSESNRAIDSRIALLDLAAKFPANDKKAWRNVADIVLSSGDAKLIAAALHLQTASEEALAQVANNAALSKSIRLEALRQISSTNRFDDARHFELFLASLNPTNPPAIRLAAAGLLNSDLTPSQKQDAVAVIRTDPLNRPLVDIASKFSGDQQKLLADFEPLLTGGDENRGQQLFIGKVGCTACHRVGKTGGLVGPDLTRVGAIRSGRDLIESLALPSAAFAQGYEPYRIELTSGDVLTGMRVRSSDDSFIIRDASGAETRLRPNDIKSTERSNVSIMPEGLLNNLAREEIRDLLAYLQKLK